MSVICQWLLINEICKSGTSVSVFFFQLFALLIILIFPICSAALFVNLCTLFCVLIGPKYTNIEQPKEHLTIHEIKAKLIFYLLLTSLINKKYGFILSNVIVTI